MKRSSHFRRGAHRVAVRVRQPILRGLSLIADFKVSASKQHYSRYLESQKPNTLS
jgi:hypothetical protein